jgi:hypothetical protein
MTTLVWACTDFDTATNTCVAEEWIQQTGLLPPLPAAEGLIIAGAMMTACSGAWALKYVRRFIWAKA